MTEVGPSPDYLSQEQEIVQDLLKSIPTIPSQQRKRLIGEASSFPAGTLWDTIKIVTEYLASLDLTTLASRQVAIDLGTKLLRHQQAIQFYFQSDYYRNYRAALFEGNDSVFHQLKVNIHKLNTPEQAVMRQLFRAITATFARMNRLN